ncbi:nicotinate (nicotinamide) nucleotide adenylyltransferase [Cryptococcus neoformans Bt1]|nr:nicotinate (nicotinamide) nucleotide adenylyltransferase [Cryptococcus neoformans var. grubii Bt1]
MASNGFKSPAPVLPAMGLHSFHNDSPPFGGAATSEMPDIPSLFLEPQQHPRPVLSTNPSARQQGPARTASNTSQTISSPQPVSSSPSETPSKAISSLKNIQDPNPHIPTTSSDDELSSTRPRRLISGYIFGNPPLPTGTGPETSAVTAASHTSTAEESRDPMMSRKFSPTLEKARDVDNRMAAELDSPPLTEGSQIDPGDALEMDSTPPRPALESPKPANSDLVSMNEPLSSDVGAGEAKVKRRKSERTRKQETGYDALEGRNDGEADLDLSAPQAEGGGSGAYLAGKAEYRFPRHRLRTKMHDENKIPLVIVACGSFSPPTYLHLRMFEMAKDEIVESQTYEIMAGYYSPVSSYYKKSGLAPAPHRVRMCELAVEHTSTWLMVDPWEAGQPEYQRTAFVLDHFDEMLNGGERGKGGLVMRDGTRRRYKIMLLAGGDLIESFGEPGVWSEPDLHVILGRFGCLIVERAGSDVWAFLLSHDILYHHRRNVVVIKQLIYNDISSTKVRLFVRRGMSIKYLLPNSVIQYIQDNKLYHGSDPKGMIGKH